MPQKKATTKKLLDNQWLKIMIAWFSSASFVKVQMVIFKAPHSIYGTSIPYNEATFYTLIDFGDAL